MTSEQLIKQHEGLRLKRYTDTEGVKRIRMDAYISSSGKGTVTIMRDYETVVENYAPTWTTENTSFYIPVDEGDRIYFNTSYGYNRALKFKITEVDAAYPHYFTVGDRYYTEPIEASLTLSGARLTEDIAASVKGSITLDASPSVDVSVKLDETIGKRVAATKENVSLPSLGCLQIVPASVPRGTFVVRVDKEV